MTDTDLPANEVRPPDERTRSRRGIGPLVVSALGVAVLAAALFAYAAVRHHEHPNPIANIRASGIPPSISTPLATLMALSPVPRHAAPNFTLVDQKGRRLSLSSFKGRAVVLEFMDPHCIDICPLVSKEFVDAYHDLGPASSHAVFLAVNVNPYNLSVSDVFNYSQEHQLNTIPAWHFFTGSVSELKSVWQNYGIEIEAPHPNADIIHTSIVFFIDPSGKERFIATPQADHTARGVAYLPPGQLASWGEGINLVTRALIKL